MAAKLAKILTKDLEEMKITKQLMEDMELKRLLREDRRNKEISNKDVSNEKQQNVVDALTNERNNLVSDLTVMQSQRRCLVDQKQANEMSQLFTQKDSLDMEIAKEKKYIEDLEEQIRKESILLERNRKKITGSVISDFRLTEENRKVGRVEDSWKSRLHAEQVQLSSAIRDNAELRKQIEVLQKAKSHFNQLFEELIQKLNKGKKIMAGIVEQSQEQFKKRDEVARKVQALKERDATDLRKRQEEMQDLEMKLSDDKRLTLFKQKVTQARKKLTVELTASKKTTTQQKDLEGRLQLLMDTWDLLRKETGLQNSKDVCDLFIRLESDNFSLFSYNNDLRNQLEAMTEKTADLMRKVEEEQEEAFSWEDEQERAKNSLQYQLERMRENGNDLFDTCEEHQRLLDRLMAKIKGLFELLKCDTWPLDQLLGENKEVTQFNYPLYLRLVEADVVELLDSLPFHPVAKVSALSGYTPRPPTSAEIVADRKVITLPCLE